MTTPAKPPIDVVSMRAVGYAADGKNLLLAFKSKYSPERNYSVPIECMKDFIADLTRLGSSAAPAGPSVKAAASPAAANSAPVAVNGQAAHAKPVQIPTQVAARTPRRWMLGTGLPQHPAVLLVFDPQAPERAAYVLAEDGARKLSSALLQQAERLAQHRSSASPTTSPKSPKN